MYYGMTCFTKKSCLGNVGSVCIGLQKVPKYGSCSNSVLEDEHLLK